MSSRNKIKDKNTGSITSKIVLEFWYRQLFQFFILDLTAIILFIIGYGISQDWSFIGLDALSGREIVDRFHLMWEQFRIPFFIILIVEVVFLISGLFTAGSVRRNLKPLQDMALHAEELSRKVNENKNNYSKSAPEKLYRMESALKDFNPKSPDAKVSTGDKELQSLEIAINNLLDRVRENSRQQERFISDASHELRTPIAVIQGYVNLLDRWGKEDKQILSESIEALKNESEHMKNLVEQLLFLARGDSGKNTLQFAPVNLKDLAVSVLEESAMIDEKHNYVLRESGEKEIVVSGDFAMLKQAMRIFLQNAAKYSTEKSTIIIGADKDGDGTPILIIQDEGKGMNSSEIVHIFERFYRGGNSRSEVKGGTGLGLSIAKWIVDSHGGEIEVLSREDFGSRITIKLRS